MIDADDDQRELCHQKIVSFPATIGLIELLSSIADAHAVAAERSAAVVADIDGVGADLEIRGRPIWRRSKSFLNRRCS